MAAVSQREPVVCQWWPPAREFISGYGSGIALVLAGHSFDTMKVRLQTGGGTLFSGPIDCLVQTIKKEGFFGLYKGVSAPLFLTGVINSVVFGLNGLIINNVLRANSLFGSKPEWQGTPFKAKEAALAGIGSGFVISVVVTPIEGVKGRLQVQYNKAAASATGGLVFNGPLDCARKVVAASGWRNGLYRGWSAVAFCRMSNYAYFGTYVYFRDVFTPEGHVGRLPIWNNVAAGALAGIMHCLACYPADVIKARMQTAPDTRIPYYRGFWHAASETWASGGMKAMFRGFTPCLIRAVPANAACFTTYEIISSLLPQELRF
jgi:solute carrier family 25 (mitochondrial carnitine/acylcarnitine transporter), member 20/29